MDRREAVRRYTETPRPAGVYRVVHAPSGRTLLGTSADAPAMLRRTQFQLDSGRHPNRQLQADWNADGPAGFTFDVVDTLPPPVEPDHDPTDDLQLLLAMWTETLDLPPELAY